MVSLRSSYRSLVDFLLAPKLATPFKIDQYRAELAVNTLLCVFAWSLAASAAVGWWVGAWPLAGLVAAGAALCVVAALVLRLTDKLLWVGAGFGVALAGLWTATAWMSGGLGSFAAGWILAVVFVGLVFGGRKLGGAFAALVAVLCGALYAGAPPLDAGALDAAQVAKLDLVGVGGLGVGLVALGILRERFIDWLVISVRQIAAEANTFVQTAPVGLVAFDMDGQIFRSNDASGDIFGHDGYEALIEANVHELLDDLELGAFKRQTEEVSGERRGRDERSDNEGPTTVQTTGRRADGTTFLAEIAGSRLPDDSGVLLAVRDITEREAYQQKLRTARDEALEASRAKSAFLANMSHELRTPLNAVIGYSEMLIEEAEFAHDDGAEPPRLIDFLPDLDRIRTAGKHQLALIDDILDLSKIEAGKMDFHYQQIDVPRLLDDLVATVRPLATQNANELELHIDARVDAMRSDLTKIRQVLLNLLSNACKFTDGGTISLTARPDGDDMLVFTVSDNGIGMSDEQLARVFEAFTQADESTTRRFGGTGLGLTIAEHFCRELGGDISVDSKLGEGTDFHVRLPVEHGP
ncbi:PAS domain S-box protein [Persicimonas caeni]|uniref:histidine kinase n=1 Tax=Persicimonas caeni TaxID=2292766 RepID=A0A4Y6PVE6_PERCE|nr:ATP-binding protein [Persicimonas caeni]QDG52210.1 PAS domain S-box protein [Persicimonas caeni]QED33432.1 PAS domain S-box protein [Persicimonas caeni]